MKSKRSRKSRHRSRIDSLSALHSKQYDSLLSQSKSESEEFFKDLVNKFKISMGLPLH